MVHANSRLARRIDVDGRQLIDEGPGAGIHGVKHAALCHSREGNAQRHPRPCQLHSHSTCQPHTRPETGSSMHQQSLLLLLATQVSQSVYHTFSSHLGLIRCLTQIIRVSTQHHIQRTTRNFGDIHKVPNKKNCISCAHGTADSAVWWRVMQHQNQAALSPCLRAPRIAVHLRSRAGRTSWQSRLSAPVAPQSPTARTL